MTRQPKWKLQLSQSKLVRLNINKLFRMDKLLKKDVYSNQQQIEWNSCCLLASCCQAFIN